MAGSYINKDAVLAGLHIAMDFGSPNNVADKTTFYMPRTSTASGNVDSHGVPFNASNRRTFSPLIKIVVPCAVEFQDARGKIETFGIINPSKVILTLLDPDYQKIKGFEYITIGGQKFLYRKTEPPIALGSLDIWNVHCTSEDES